MRINPLLLTDFYKTEHYRQYPEGTTLVYSNFTPRKSRIPGIDKMVFFGLQYFIKEYLMAVLVNITSYIQAWVAQRKENYTEATYYMTWVILSMLWIYHTTSK